MVRKFLILLLFASCAFAEDEVLSVYGIGSAADIQRFGAGVEFGTLVGRRTVLGAGFELAEPQDSLDRDFRVRLDARLLYGSEFKTHWYPMASVQWRADRQIIEPWAGAGFQRELADQLGLFADVLWRPFETEFQSRIGLRIWLSRFQTLDSRVDGADPMGAVYRGGSRESVSSNSLSIEPIRAPQTAATAELVPPSPVSLRQTETPVLSQSPAAAPVVNTQTAITDQWYVHLGFFAQRQSMQELEIDSRLTMYQDSLITYYDDARSGYRFLIGPTSQAMARETRQSLLSSGLESFLYQLPTD